MFPSLQYTRSKLPRRALCYGEFIPLFHIIDELRIEEILNQYLAEVRKMCRDDRIDYVQLDTEEKLDVALSTFLAMRQGAQRT